MAAVTTRTVAGANFCEVIEIPGPGARGETLQASIACPTAQNTDPTATNAGAPSNPQGQASTTQPAGQPASSVAGVLPVPTGNNVNGPGNPANPPLPSTQISGPASVGVTATVSATTTATPGSPNNKGLPGGAVAGVAIGMLLAGIMIAGLIFFVLLRRQKKQQAMSAAVFARQHAPYTESSVGPEKGATVVGAAVGSIDDLIPQPVEDDTITGELSKIRDNIKNHVRTYYHSGSVSIAEMNEAGIRDIAMLTGSSTSALIKALSDISTRDSALRAIVGSVILTRCSGERSPSLLPNALAAPLAAMSVNNQNISQPKLFSKWKTITGALIQQQFGQQNQNPERAQSFSDTIASLDSVLAPFVKGRIDGGQRRKNLDMILTRAANFAFLLFTQPGSFRFDFPNRQGGLTVFPALFQTFGDQGQLLSPIKVLTEKEVVAV